jgi:hypothetical protein
MLYEINFYKSNLKIEEEYQNNFSIMIFTKINKKYIS